MSTPRSRHTTEDVLGRAAAGRRMPPNGGRRMVTTWLQRTCVALAIVAAGCARSPVAPTAPVGEAPAAPVWPQTIRAPFGHATAVPGTSLELTLDRVTQMATICLPNVPCPAVVTSVSFRVSVDRTEPTFLSVKSVLLSRQRHDAAGAPRLAHPSESLGAGIRLRAAGGRVRRRPRGVSRPVAVESRTPPAS